MDCDNLEHPLEKPKKQCRMKTRGRSGHGCPLWTQIRTCAHVPVCATLCSGEAGVLTYFSFKISSKFPLLSGRASGIIYLYLCACLQVLSFRADMPIHEMRTAVLRFFTERGLTVMRNRATLAQHSTAQHSTAQHSTAQHSTAQHSTG